MIAGIDRQADIYIFLEENDLDQLSTGKEIAGILIRDHKPEKQGTIKVVVDDNRKNLNNCFGIGVDDQNYWGVGENYNINVFIGDEYYKRLSDTGKTGTRQSMLDGSKIHIYQRMDFDEKMMKSDLEFYRDNKDKFQR